MPGAITVNVDDASGLVIVILVDNCCDFLSNDFVDGLCLVFCRFRMATGALLGFGIKYAAYFSGLI